MNRYVEFTLLISGINRSIIKIKNMEMSELGLKGTHVSCLYYLYLEKGLTAKELCERCSEDKGAISRIIEYLEKTGYISCDDTKEKRYRANLYLTEKGQKIGQEVSNKINNILIGINDCMSDKEREIFYKCLNNVAEKLEDLCERGV